MLKRYAINPSIEVESLHFGRLWEILGNGVAENAGDHNSTKLQDILCLCCDFWDGGFWKRMETMILTF